MLRKQEKKYEAETPRFAALLLTREVRLDSGIPSVQDLGLELEIIHCSLIFFSKAYVARRIDHGDLQREEKKNRRNR